MHKNSYIASILGLATPRKKQLTNLFVNAPAPGQYVAHCCMKADDVYNISHM